MPTYRRFNCVERSIMCFLSQNTSLDTELIIYNTDIEYPLYLDDSFDLAEKNKIKIINNNTDYHTKANYTNTGAIRRDALTHATGDFYITWDDDDLFFPWNIQQCYDGLMRTGKRAWKPLKSFIWTNTETPQIEYNYMEATVMMYKEEATFHESSGPEGLNWFERLRNQNELVEDEYSIPAYCFYWKDPYDIGGQKQSGYINEPNNFQMHLDMTNDFAKRNLTKKHFSEYQELFNCFSQTLQELNKTKQELITKYVTQQFLF